MRRPKINMYYLFNKLGYEDTRAGRIRTWVSMGTVVRNVNSKYATKNDNLVKVWKSYQDSIDKGKVHALDTLLKRCTLLRRLPMTHNMPLYRQVYGRLPVFHD